jgi:hypothetical protein
MAAKLERISIGGQEFWVEMAEVEAPPASAKSGDDSGGAGDKSPHRKALASDKENTSNDGSALAKKIPTTDLENLISRLVTPARAALAKAGDFKECSVELSLGLKGEVGFFLAKGEANATLKVSVKWASEAKPKLDAPQSSDTTSDAKASS